ncbi:MAG: hypothetical protein FWD57_16515, partial [Polyangiaceae bacterium]|nr:hypothetical protein [Polyangiaceae bacterium]
IYSMGALVYTMLSSKLVFDGRTFGDLLLQICIEPLPKLTNAAPWLPSSADDWFEKSCARLPEDRFQTIAEQVAALPAALGLTKRNSIPDAEGPGSASVPLDKTLVDKIPAGALQNKDNSRLSDRPPDSLDCEEAVSGDEPTLIARGFSCPVPLAMMATAVARNSDPKGLARQSNAESDENTEENTCENSNGEPDAAWGDDTESIQQPTEDDMPCDISDETPIDRIPASIRKTDLAKPVDTRFSLSLVIIVGTIVIAAVSAGVYLVYYL